MTRVEAAGALLMALVLTSCIGDDMRAAQDAKDDQQCLSTGAEPGSDAYVACRTQLSTARTAASNERQSRIEPGISRN